MCWPSLADVCGQVYCLNLDLDLELAMLTSSFAAPFSRAPAVLAAPSLEARINPLLQEAGRLHQLGELAQARTHYLDILALSGEHPQALFLLALVCFLAETWIATRVLNFAQPRV